MIYFTSDHHFDHANIIKYCHRPFKNVDEMNNQLMDDWNDCIKPNDIVYHLGDFTLGNRLIAEKYFRRLHGYIHILENPWHHDKRWLRMQLFMSADVHEIDYELPIVILELDVPVILCHYPFEEWDRSHYGSIHLHGHSHGMLLTKPHRLDVGVDNAYKLLGKYRPFSMEEILKFGGA